MVGFVFTNTSQLVHNSHRSINVSLEYSSSISWNREVWDNIPFTNGKQGNRSVPPGKKGGDEKIPLLF